MFDNFLVSVFFIGGGLAIVIWFIIHAVCWLRQKPPIDSTK